MRDLKIFAMIGIAAALVTGCTAAAAPAPAQAQSGTITATLTDMKIAVDRSSAPAGPISFVVKNTGAVVHELVVIKTDASQDTLAADTAEVGKMDETGNVGETGDMQIGESKTFTVTLSAGRYVLMCNEIGHYGSGMHMAFTVN